MRFLAVPGSGMTIRLAIDRPIPSQLVLACSAVTSEWMASMAV